LRLSFRFVAMKKGLVLLLLMVYGLSSVGATLNFQYCCGKLDKINSIPVKAKKCCKPEMKKKMEENGCCNNKTFELKIKDEQVAVPAYVLKADFTPEFISQEKYYAVTTPGKLQQHVPEVFAPPPHRDNLLTFVCSFRI
jgi:hypothetical protein